MPDASTSAPAAAPAAPSSTVPAALDPGQRKGSVIDETSQRSLSEKIVRDPTPAKNDPPEKKAEAAEPEKPRGPQKYKVKVDGKEQELTFEELSRGYQRGAGAEKKYKEAAELEKKIQQVLQVIGSDTGAALKAAGLSDDQIETFAVKLISEKQQAFLEQEKLKNAKPEERELFELREKVKKFEEQQRQAQEAQRQWAIQQRQQQMSQYVISMLEELPKEYRKDDFVASRALDAAHYVFENWQEMAKKGIDYSPKGAAKSLRFELEGLAKKLGVSPAQAAAAVAEAAAPETKSPSTPVSRRQEAKKEPEKKEPITQARLIREITLGER